MHNEEVFHSPPTFISRYQKYLQELVYGGIDGSVTTFAVVAGATGAELPSYIVVILGFTNLFADGFSMSIGNYLSQKSLIHIYEKHRKREYWEIDNMYDKEVEEIRDIFSKKGFEGKLLDDAVNVITSDKDRWVDMMMKEELEMIREQKSPLKSGFMTFTSFVVIGLIPLLVYIFDFFFTLPKEMLFIYSAFLTSISFVLIGFLKSYVTETSHTKGILQTLLLGILAALVAYYVGDVLGKVVINLNN